MTMGSTVPPLFPGSPTFLNGTPTEEPYSNSNGSAENRSLVLGVALELGILAVVLGNLLVLLSLKFFQDKWLTTDVLLFSLSLADFLCGLIPLQIVIVINYFMRTAWSRVLCDFYVSFVNTCRFASAGTVTAIAIERALMLTRPFLYHTSVTPSKARKVVVITWLLSIVISVLPFTGFGKSGFKNDECFYHLSNLGLEYTAFALSLSLLLLMTVLICSVTVKLTSVRFVQRQTRMLRVNNPQVSTANAARAGGKNTSSGNRRQSIPRGVRDVQRLASMMAVVVLLYYVSWLPILIANAVPLITKKRIHHAAVLVTGMISLLYAVANPVVYAKMSPRYWRGYKCVLAKVLGKCGLKPEALRRMSTGHLTQISLSAASTTTRAAQVNRGLSVTDNDRRPSTQEPVTATEPGVRSDETCHQSDSNTTAREDFQNENNRSFDTKL